MQKYTRVKHEVLENIFTRGLLSKRERQIAWVVIRESWGWDSGKSNWTKRALSNECFVQKTGLDKAVISKILSSMVAEKKLLIEDGKYSFNEHSDRWQKLTKRQLSKSQKVDKTSTESWQNVNWKLTKSQLLVDKTSTFDGLEIDVTTISMKDLRALLKLPKESIKEIFKEIFKESTSSLRLFYKEKINPKGLKTFSDTRQRMVKNRLENFSLNELKQVVESVSKSKWHTENKQNSFELLFRSDAKVEQYLNLKPDEQFAGEKQWLLKRKLANGKG